MERTQVSCGAADLKDLFVNENAHQEYDVENFQRNYVFLDTEYMMLCTNTMGMQLSRRLRNKIIGSSSPFSIKSVLRLTGLLVLAMTIRV